MKRLVIFLALLLVGIGLLAIFGGQPLSIFWKKDRPASRRASASTRPSADTPLSALGTGQAPGVSISEFEKGISLWGLDKNQQPFLHIEGDKGRIARDRSCTIEPSKISFAKDAKNAPPIEIATSRTRATVSGMPPKLTGDQPVLADDAVVKFLGSSAWMKDPFTVRVPHLALNFRDVNGGLEPQGFSSDDAFQLSGESLNGTGKGFFADAKREEFIIYQNPQFELKPGALSSLRDRVVLRSAGRAVISMARDWIPETSIQLYDSAFFRFETQSSERFLETTARQIGMRALHAPGTRGGALRPRSFDSAGDVSFRTEQLEGTCETADGQFGVGGLLETLIMNGPYRVDLRGVSQSRPIPGIGRIENLALSGMTTATARRIAPAPPIERCYELTAVGSPEVSFVEGDTRKRGTVRAETLVIVLSDRAATSFRAIGRATVDCSLGNLSGDEIEFIQKDEAFSVVVHDRDNASFRYIESSAAPRTSPAAAERLLLARTITIDPQPGGKARVVAAGDVRGWLTSDGSLESFFECERLDTTPGAGRSGSLELTGRVHARMVRDGVSLYGDRLVLHSTESGAARTPSKMASVDGAYLYGSPATVDQFDAQTQQKRTLTSPEVWFREQRIFASSPVEVAFPGSVVTGNALGPMDSGERGLVWLGGSHLEVLLDSEGRQSKAVLDGPLTSRGSLEVRGDHVELDFLSGEHFVIAKEGERVRVRSFETPDASGFLAEAPRLDFRSSDESLTLTGLGTIEVTQSELRFGALTPVDPSAAPEKTKVRFDTTGKVVITKELATFFGNVVCTGTDARGDTSWRVLCGLLTVAFDAARRPSHIRAVDRVTFRVGDRFEGSCDELESDAASEILQLNAVPPRDSVLDFGNLHYVGRWLKFNTRTYLVESGAAQLSASPPSKSIDSNPR